MRKKVKGKVYFVGAGPGDPGLLTLRGAELLREAEVVIHDGLVHPALLDLCRSALAIPVQKRQGFYRRGGQTASQSRINQLLLRYARVGRTVVRLKGGDPLVFGRGAEEAVFLKRRGIPFEFVPGVSAGTAVPAYAGIPLTERAHSSQVLFVTGHEDPSKKESAVDWKQLGSFRGTLVSFMSVQRLPELVRGLRSGGMPGSTPAAVIERGTLAEQKIAEGTLATIAARARRLGIQSPALTVIGRVVGLRKALQWFEKRPLAGARILVTRPQSTSGTMRKALEQAGARVFEFPAIEILPPRNSGALDRAASKAGSFDWIIFASVHSVIHFWESLARLKKDSRHLGAAKIAAIGSSTARELQNRGVNPDLVPPSYHSGSFVQALGRRGDLAGKKILLPRTDIASEPLREGLLRFGAQVTQVTAYRTRLNRAGRRELVEWLKHGEIDLAAFTSASTVEGFFRALGPRRSLASALRFASIGPVTSRSLRRHGVRVYCEARPHTIPALVRALSQKGVRRAS